MMGIPTLLDFWALRGRGGPASALLGRLARLPIAARWPAASLILAQLRCPDPDVRASALRALHGLTGHAVWQGIVHALDDGESRVRAAAFEALVASSREQPLRRAHAVLHPRADIRRRAIAEHPDTVTVALLLPALLDPELRDAARSHIAARADPARDLRELAQSAAVPPELLGDRLDAVLHLHSRTEALRAILRGVSERERPAEMAGFVRRMLRAQPLDAVIERLLPPLSGRLSSSTLAGLAAAALLPHIAEDPSPGALARALGTRETISELFEGSLPLEIRRAAAESMIGVCEDQPVSFSAADARALCAEGQPAVHATLLGLGGPKGAHLVVSGSVAPVVCALLGLGVAAGPALSVLYRSPPHGPTTRSVLSQVEGSASSAPMQALGALLIHTAGRPVIRRKSRAGGETRELPERSLIKRLSLRRQRWVGALLSAAGQRLPPEPRWRRLAPLLAGVPTSAEEALVLLRRVPGPARGSVARQMLQRDDIEAGLARCAASSLIWLLDLDRDQAFLTGAQALSLEERLREHPDPAIQRRLHLLSGTPAPEPPPDSGSQTLDRATERLCSAAPLEEVARDLRALSPDPAALGSHLARTLSQRDDVGLGALIFLYRWPKPMLALRTRVPDPGGLLAEAQGWAFPALRQAAWGAAAAGLNRSRWRGRGTIPPLDAALAAARDALLGVPGPGAPGAFPASSSDLERVLNTAARVLVAIHSMAPERTRPLRGDLQARVDELPEQAVRVLQPILGGWTRRTGRSATVRGDPSDWALLERACSSEDLSRLLASADLALVEAACVRALELGERGAAALLSALFDETARHRLAVAETLSAWPPVVRQRAATLRRRAETAPTPRLFLALGALAAGEEEGADDLHAVVGHPALMGLFNARLVARLTELTPTPVVTARLCAPNASTSALRSFCTEALCGDLAAGSIPALRALLSHAPDLDPLCLQAARALLHLGDETATPVAAAAALRIRQRRRSSADCWSDGLPDGAVPVVVEGLLALDPATPVALVREGLTRWSERLAGEDAAALRERVSLSILRATTSGDLRRGALELLDAPRARRPIVRRLAEVTRWARQQSLRLLGRALNLELIAGEALGYTRLDVPRIHVNPAPLLTGHPDGAAIVRGLVIHELGHHRYNNDEDGRAAHQAAREEGLSSLLNLVQDEHLERNLRALDPAWGDDLKKLAAWAFLRAQREVGVLSLVRMGVGPTLQTTAARAQESVGVRQGVVLAALAQAGNPFARFMRALRLGWGNRDGDPIVAAGLALFGRRFKKAGNLELLEIARALNALFFAGDPRAGALLGGGGAAHGRGSGGAAPRRGRGLPLPGGGPPCGGNGEPLLGGVGDLHDVAAGQAADLERDGLGVTSDEVIAEADSLEREARRERSPPDADPVNREDTRDFAPIVVVERLPADPAAHRLLVSDVLAAAALLRRSMQELGLRHEPVRPRSRGFRVDRARLRTALLRGDPRILVARRLALHTDLFLGLVVDCSGSMSAGGRMERARRFAALLAEACRGLRGVDLRVLGFTDTRIFDAGTADRCAAAALVAAGGNNDAGALDHAGKLAFASRRSARLLVMISDGRPTECTVPALRGLVQRLSRRGLALAQVAVAPIAEADRCFPDYIEIFDDEISAAARAFGRVVLGLVRSTMRR